MKRLFRAIAVMLIVLWFAGGAWLQISRFRSCRDHLLDVLMCGTLGLLGAAAGGILIAVIGVGLFELVKWVSEA